MPTPSKRRQPVPRQLEQRKRLHEAVDRILDGPDDGDPDLWVRQVLVDIGFVIGAAAPALDYEVGRIISGVDRRRGDFPFNLSWQSAEIGAGPQQYSAWVAAGAVARGDPPSLETQQRALAALLRPIASISCHTWLHELADSLEALSFGEVRPPLKPSGRGLWAVGKAMTAWELRLRALRWAEFQFAAGRVNSKREALRSVAREFGRSLDAILEWRSVAAKELGEEVVREALELGRGIGEYVRLPSSKANERDRRYCLQLERAYSHAALNKLAKRLKGLPRKKHKGGK